MAVAKTQGLETDIDSLLELHSSDEDDAHPPEVGGRTVEEILNDLSSDESLDNNPPSFPPENPSRDANSRLSQTFTTELPARGNSVNRLLDLNLRISNVTSARVETQAEVSENELRWKSPSISALRLGLSLSDRFPALAAKLRPSPRPGAAIAAAAAASKTIKKSSSFAESFESPSATKSDKCPEITETDKHEATGESSDAALLQPQTNSINSADDNENLFQEDGISTPLKDNDEIVKGIHHRDKNGVAELPLDRAEIVERAADGEEGFQLALVEASLKSGFIREEEEITDTHYLETVTQDANATSRTAENDDSGSTENLTVEAIEVHSDPEESSAASAQTTGAEFETIYRANSDAGSKHKFQQERNVNVDDKEMEDPKQGEKDRRIAFKPLELAEELEKKDASSGLHWEEGVASQPMRLKGIRQGPPAIGHLHIDFIDYLSKLFSSSKFKRDQGSPQCLAVHLTFIAVGMSKGSVFVFPTKSSSAGDSIDSNKAVCLSCPAEAARSSVTSTCFNQQGDLLLVGYGNGGLVLWEPPKLTPAKVITVNHNSAVVHTLFLGQDSQNSRQFKAISGDCKGNAFIHTITVVPLFRVFNISSQCLLDSKASDKALCISPLLADESHLVSTGSNTSMNSFTSGSLGDMMGGVVGGDAAKKFFSDTSNSEEAGGVVIIISQQFILVVRLIPTLSFCAKVSRPDGIRDGAIPYAAWRRVSNQKETMTQKSIGSSSSNANAEDRLLSANDDSMQHSSHDQEEYGNAALLAIAWDKKVQVAQLSKSNLKVKKEWSIDCSAIGVAWLEDQMLLILTSMGQLCLFTIEGIELDRRRLPDDVYEGESAAVYHTHFINSFGNPEKAYHNSLAVRGTALYMLVPKHVYRSHLLPWKDRIKVLQNAGDWMGALQMAMDLYDGNAQGVTGLPKNLEALREAIMPFLLQLLSSYVDEAFSYISLSFSNQNNRMEAERNGQNMEDSVAAQVKEQFARVGGVAIEFCVYINRSDVLFDSVFLKFIGVRHEGTFLELLEPYILKDVLGFLPPEVMQALVEHYSRKGWLQRIEQCVLHMDIASLDFNQVVKLCKEHGLYSALIYLFNRGLDDFKSPLEELFAVAQVQQRPDAKAIGYKLLVYLKYCFLGLAFPPGHGSLAPERVPSLRKELIEFLLNRSCNQNENYNTCSSVSMQSYKNLFYLLSLDTEATLHVLKCAFFDSAFAIKDSYISNIDGDGPGLQESNELSLSQSLINTLSAIIECSLSGVLTLSREEAVRDEPSENKWLSEYEIHILLKFIACFVASKYASVSRNMLSCILQHLTRRPDQEGESNGGHFNIEAPNENEKLMLAVLKAVPVTEWDPTDAFKLAERAHFYQVLGFICILKGEYVAALESYTKDTENIIYAFAFISNTLKKLDTEMPSSLFQEFRLAVLSYMPNLVQINREAAFLLIVEHFNNEIQNIMTLLGNSPQILFLYLKTLFEVQSHGMIHYPLKPPERRSDFSYFGLKRLDQSSELAEYLKRISNIPALLRRNNIEVTNEIAELYLELLCQFEPKSVFHFLQSFENYRLEHCLKLCQEYGVTDAAAFLLERVGDVGSALSLIISDINVKFQAMDTAVAKWFRKSSSICDSEERQINALLIMPEVQVVHNILQTTIGLCQRNTLRLHPQESQSLWFRLLDVFGGPARDLFECEKVYRDRKSQCKSLHRREDANELCKWKVVGVGTAAYVLRLLFSRFIGEIAEGMMGHIPLSTIMAKLLSDHGNQEFKDLKGTILGMVGAYGFERTILDTAKTLVEDDTYYNLNILRRGAAHAFSPISTYCCICSRTLFMDSLGSRVCLFSCGHAAHLHCKEIQDPTPQRSDSAALCPICMPKRKSTAARSKLIETEYNVSVGSQASSIPFANDTIFSERSYGSRQQSRFELLTNLEKGEQSLDLGLLPSLRLSPPLVYHERKPSAIIHQESGSDTTETKSHESIISQRTKSVQFQFPLKNSIFGSGKSKKS